MQNLDLDSEFIFDYYENYIDNPKETNHYPLEYNNYFNKYDKDILMTHCKTVASHHMDISSFLIDIYDNKKILFNHIEQEEKHNKSIFYKLIKKLKNMLLTLICSELFIELLFLCVSMGYALRACFIDNNFDFFIALTLFLAANSTYNIFKLIVDIKIKKVKSFKDCSYYKPRNKMKDLLILEDAIFNRFFNFLQLNNTIPERKLLEVMKKHPCMYNDKTFFGLYLMAKQNIAVFEDAENIVDSKYIEEYSTIIKE